MIKTLIKISNYSGKYISFNKKLSVILGVEEKKIDDIYGELYNSAFFKGIKNLVSGKGNFFDFSMLNKMRAPVLYVMTRISRPDTIVETGVANGFSTSFILKALEMNNKGRLYSIDFPNQPGEEIDNEAGWIIPQELKQRWKLIIGDAKEKLPLLMQELGKIDIFYHDSDHSYKHIWFELDTVWEGVKEGGFIVSDDSNLNDAFINFASEKKIDREKFYWLGIARKRKI